MGNGLESNCAVNGTIKHTGCLTNVCILKQVEPKESTQVELPVDGGQVYPRLAASFKRSMDDTAAESMEVDEAMSYSAGQVSQC